MKKYFVMSMVALAVAGPVHAQDSSNTSTVKTDDVAPADKPKDIDQEITNARMRASLGSKSKWSIKTALGYNGGSLEKPFNDIRPAYRAGADVPTLSALMGNVGVNYRMNNGDSLSLSTGLSILNPFHGDLSRENFADPRDTSKELSRTDFSNPTLEWSRGYKVDGMQMSTSASYTQYTSQSDVDVYNGIGDISISQSILKDFGTSGWTAGISAVFGQAFYNGDAPLRKNSKGEMTRPRQSEMSLGLYPFAEHAFNDRFSFRTVFGYFGSTRYRLQEGASGGDPAALEADVPYQSMGLGISVTRDIYLYPNVQFTPFDIRADRSNVALSANINMF